MRNDPKSRFLLSKDKTSAHARVVEQDTFREAVDVALLQYCQGLNSPRDGSEAAANYFRIEGSRDFSKVLMTLAENTPAPKPIQYPQLNPNA